MKVRDDKLDLTLREACRLAQQIPDLPRPSASEPDDESLICLLDGAAPPAELVALQRRVDASAFARERLETLREALAEVAAATSTVVNPIDQSMSAPRPSLARLSFLWAPGSLRYLWGTLEPRSLMAVPMTTRSGSFRRPVEETSYFDFAHHLDGLDVVIQVERVRDDYLDVQLSFSGDSSLVERIRVTLADRQGDLLDSQPVEQGKTRFAALAPLPHELLITTAQRELGRVRLDVHAD